MLKGPDEDDEDDEEREAIEITDFQTEERSQRR
jgi:hypothetical protein